MLAKGLHQTFYALVGRGLEQFQPEVVLEANGIKSVTDITLKSWSERPCMKSIHDEEATGFKMVNFLAGPCGLRVYPEPEGSHPMWNDFLRSIAEADLKPVLLKASLLCNWTRGPFGSGTHQCKLSDAAAA